MAYGVAREIFAQIRSATKTQKQFTEIMTLVDCYSDSFSLANRIFLSVSICCMISSPDVILLNMIGAFDG
jgi:hypothetical protein